LAYAQKRAETARAPLTKRPARWWWAGLAATAALLMVTMAQLSGPLAERHAKGLDGAAQAPIAYEQKQAPFAGASRGAFPAQAPSPSADAKDEVAPDVFAAPPPPPPPPSAVAASSAKTAEGGPERFKESKGQGAMAMRDRRAVPSEGLKKKRSLAPDGFGSGAAQDDRSLGGGAQLNAAPQLEAAAPAPEEKADVRGEAESGAWVAGDAEEGRAQGVQGGVVGGIAGGGAAGDGAAAGGKVGAMSPRLDAPPPASPARAAPKAASKPARTRAAEPATSPSPSGAVLAQDKPSGLKNTQREGATTPAAEALARLQAALPDLKGASRAQALERICGLELTLGRRKAAEATLRTLEAEFPTAPETARARASLAAPVTPGG
jgi:hypothetical protein